LWIDKKAFTKPFFSEFLQVKHEECCAVQDEDGNHLATASASYRLQVDIEIRYESSKIFSV